MSPAAADIRRHLATVLAADAVGFTQRMRENASAAVTALFECRAVLTEVIEAFNGSIVGTPGDFFLALMPSGLEAVEAAVEIQRRLASRNDAMDEIMQVQYRIGIGIGDIYEHGSDVLGDAVNVASRLQAIAQPGGILASAAVREAVGRQPNVSFEDLGDHNLKNIAEAVRVYAVSERPGAEPAEPFGTRRTSPAKQVDDGLTEDQALGPVMADRLPVKPVVEIEPFRAVGGSPEDKLFAEGLSDEILAMLTSLGTSLVVRQMVMDPSAPQTSGLVRRYRLGGSIRLAPAGIRIVAHLSEASSGNAIWADRIDYRIDQSFDAHEVIARQVVTALQVTLTEGEQAQLWSGGTTNIRAWEMFQRGHDLERRFTRHGHREACRCYTEALRQDPHYISAIVALAFCHLDEIRLGWAEDEASAFAEAQALYQHAMALHCDHPECLALQAYIELHQRNDAAAVAAMEKAARLSPRSSELAAYLGNIYDTVGRYEEAIIAYRRAMWLSQHFPAWIASNLALTLCVTGRAEEACKLVLGVVAHHPDYARAHLCLAIAYARLGRPDKARISAAELMHLDPQFSIDDWARNRPYADPEVMTALLSDMRAVGLR
ncbi:MAG TPA: adenylate/guanylate cyclase domain-containing protein [Terriglobia bacterium]|nr:adenylate/guanylate cyclase domain-containing protein [Terriglobia bacterium]